MKWRTRPDGTRVKIVRKACPEGEELRSAVQEMATEAGWSDHKLTSRLSGNNACFAPFHTKNAIILPRQARDKHRESTHKKDALNQSFFINLTGFAASLLPLLQVRNIYKSTFF